MVWVAGVAAGSVSSSRASRQLTTESLLLAMAGGLAGTALAWAGLRVLARTFLLAYPDLHDVAIDGTVLVAAAIVSLATGIALGVLPAVQSAHPDLLRAIRESSRGLTVAAGAARLRGGFVIAQVALALVLVIGAVCWCAVSCC